MFETPEDILEHFGVKGMRWGVRKDRASGGTESSTERAARRKENIKKAAIAGGVVAVVAGGLLAHHILSTNGQIKANTPSKEVSDTLKKFIDANKNVKYNSVAPKPMMVKTKTDPRALQAFQDRVQANIKAANVDMMRWYESSQTPLHKREYLPDLPERHYSNQVRRDAAATAKLRAETAEAKRKAQESLAPSLKRAKQNRRRI